VGWEVGGEARGERCAGGTGWRWLVDIARYMDEGKAYTANDDKVIRVRVCHDGVVSRRSAIREDCLDQMQFRTKLRLVNLVFVSLTTSSPCIGRKARQQNTQRVLVDFQRDQNHQRRWKQYVGC